MSTRQDWHSWAAVGVTVHLHPGVTLASTIHANENRVVLHVQGTNCADLCVFADRADLDRLVDTVIAARDELAAAAATSAPKPTGTAAADAA